MKFKSKIISLFLLISTSSLSASFKVPDYETYTLKNGLQVYLMQQTEVPIVNVSLVVKAGAIHDGTLYGLANLTGEALQFGSGKLTKTEIEDKLAFVGANFSSVTSKEMSRLNLNFLNKDKELLLPLFKEIALNPVFDKTEFDKFKKRYISQLEQQKESPRSIISDQFSRLYYGNHPYGNPVSGDENSINNIKIQQIKDFYQKYYTPKNSALIVVGDFDTAKWKADIENLFGKWKGEKPTEQLMALDNAPSKTNVLLIDKDDARETTFLVGGKGISVSHPDAVAIQVINTILGGRFTSWLNDELRVNSGLTYGARSRFDSYRYGGHFVISTFTKTATTFEALDLAQKTYMRLWEQGIDEEILASAKAYVKGRFPPRYETSDQLSNLLSNMWALELNDSFINDFEKNVDSLDMKKANEIARKLFPKDNLQYVLIGKASDIREKAANYGEVKEVKIKDLKY